MIYKTLFSAALLLAVTAVDAQTYWKKNKDVQAKVILTDAKTNQKFADNGKHSFVPFEQPKETDVCIFIEPDKKYQEVFAIGGAITDASAETFYKLPKKQQNEIIAAYYGKNGIGYNLVRTSMNSSDFSTASYTYVKENDKQLKTFSVKKDDQYKIPLIKLAQKAIGKDFMFYFSPWSPPAWMKDTNNMLRGGKLLKEYYQSWANYYVKFIQEYEKRGIPVWGLTIQNEPMATQTWESCIYTADEERDFLKNNLGPTLWKAGYKDKKVIIWDHNRDLIYQRATTLLSDPQAYKYVSGIGFHWYETWTGSKPMFENVKLTQEAYPEKFLIFTEGTKEKFDFTQIYNVNLGELYAKNMINDFNNGLAAWTDWNILLDETGGPNHVGNFCFAPIIADTRTNEIHYTYAYYYIGHISKYIDKNAKRLGTSSNRDFLQATSFVNTDGQIVVVVMNEGDKDTDFNLWIEGKAAKLSAPAHSIQTVLL